MNRRHLKLTHFVSSVILAVSSTIGAAFGAVVAPPASVAEAATLAPTDVPLIYHTDYAIGDMIRQDNQLFWISYENCLLPGQEFGPPCKIKSKPVAGGITRTIFDNTASGVNFVESNNIAADDQFVYFFGGSGSVARVSRSASAILTPTVISQRELSGASGELAVDNTYVYWFENTFSPNASKMFRAPKAGGPRELMNTYTNNLRDLTADGNGAVYFIHAGVIIVPDILIKLSPLTSNTFTETTVSAPVNSYALSNGNLFWAEGVSTNNRLIKSAPQNDFSSPITRATVNGTGNPKLREMAVDNTNIYYQDYRGTGGQIFRLPLTPTSGTPQAITAAPTQVNDIVSDNRNIFWQDGTQILRLSTSASAVTLDLTAGAANIEVIQAVQRNDNDVPLVSGKETFVRVFGRILSSSEGFTSLNAWPMVQLRGTRGGVPLPDSPLTPINFEPIRSAPVDRTNMNNWLFRLPASWADGTVTLQAEVNPRRTLNETSYANNVAQTTVNFNRKAPMCIDVVPVATTRGTSFVSPSAFLSSIFARAQSALPTHELRGFFRGGSPLRKPRWYLFDSDPYSLTQEDKDAGWLMFWLNARYLFGDDPGGCGAVNANTTRTAIIPNIPNREVNGMAAAWSLVFFAIPGDDGVNARTPAGGVTFAHELGHIYGRGHVNCGGPAGVDGSYPYDPCQTDNDVSGNGHLGFDPLSPQLLLPQNTGDLMSYTHLIDPPKTRWPSDYTYRGIFNALNNRSLMAASRIGPRNAQRVSADRGWLVSGIISGTDTVLMNHAYEVTGTIYANVSRFISTTTQPSADYQVRAYSGTSLIAQAPLQMVHIEEASTSDEQFNSLIDVSTQPDRIEIVKLPNTVLHTLTAGSNAPTLNITGPTAGSSVNDTLNLTWTGSDADSGDILRYVVRYSNDNGNTWIVLEPSTTNTQLNVDMSTMPGGELGQLQVIASDGLHTTSATVGPINVAKHVPSAYVMDDHYNGLSIELGTSAAQSETVVLRGYGYDAEDGPLTGTSLQWQISGPTTRTGDGEQFSLIGLPPGTYQVRLTAQDSDGNQSIANTTLTISPKRVFDSAAAITVDGFCDDAAYDDELDPITLQYTDSTQAGVRFAHANNALYACFDGLPVGAMTNSFAGLRLDLNNSADAKPQGDDRGFFIGRDGAAWSATGNGVDLIPDALPTGVFGAVSQNEAGTSWSAELRIDETELGGWNKLIRMKVGHYWRDFGGDDANWPNPSVYDIPSTWGLTALGQLGQSINFGTLSDRSSSASPVTISASASSGLPVGFSSLTPSVCTVDGATVTLLTVGTCTIHAEQNGNASYLPAPSIDRSFNVTANQQIYLPMLAK